MCALNVRPGCIADRAIGYATGTGMRLMQIKLGLTIGTHSLTDLDYEGKDSILPTLYCLSSVAIFDILILE